jgi:hypothetical protein
MAMKLWLSDAEVESLRRRAERERRSIEDVVREAIRQLGHGGLGGLRVPADDEHPGARAREHAGDALADAPGRAGHHDGAARD